MVARGAEFEAARSAGVGGDVAAEGRRVLSRIGRVELLRSDGGGLQVAQDGAGTGDSTVWINFELIEAREGNRPAGLRNRSPGQSGKRAHEGDRNLIAAGAGEDCQQLGFVVGREKLVGMAVEIGRVADFGH